MSSATSLTPNDSTILARLFDPELSPATPTPAASSTPLIPTLLSPSTLPYEPNLPPNTLSILESTELSAISLCSTPTPTLDQLRTAKRILDDLVTTYPHYASARNNRAQCGKLIIDLLEKEEKERMEVLSEMKVDLDTAIELLMPREGEERVLGSKAMRILSNAYTQRGTLYFLASESSADWWEEEKDKEEKWKLEKPKLEELAHADFAEGSRLGNELAREMSVRTNPYAKLCGTMLKGVMKAEIESYY